MDALITRAENTFLQGIVIVLYMCAVGAANCQLNTGTPDGHTSRYICPYNGGVL